MVQCDMGALETRLMQQLNGRRGANFPIRLTAAERAELEAMRNATEGPRGLGPWLLWAARQAFDPPAVLPRRQTMGAMPTPCRGMALPARAARAGITRARTWSGNADDSRYAGNTEKRLILDLCAGTGAWSDPYRLAPGYDVVRVSLPDCDVRTFSCPAGVHGVLCAPPCNEFSLAKNGHERDIPAGLEIVGACLRIVVGCRPIWWALENPVGLLQRYLGPPTDVFEPYEFGDPHTKATALWGNFNIPKRGPYVEPLASAMDRPTAEERAITPDGFARAFFEANP